MGVWLAPLAVIPAVLALSAFSPSRQGCGCWSKHLLWVSTCSTVTVLLCPSPWGELWLHTPHLAEPKEGTAATFLPSSLPSHKVPSQPLGAGLSSAQLNGNSQPQGFLQGKSSWLMRRLFFSSEV